MSSMHRTVLVPSGPLRFSGAVPARRALAFDAREGRWMLRREVGQVPADVDRSALAAACLPAAPASPPVSEPPGAPGLRRGAGRPRAATLALGALGVVVGIAAGALVDRYGPVMGAVASGSLPVGAVRGPGADLAVASAAWEAPSSAAPEHDVTPADRIAKDAASAASLPVPPFILARARREAALPAAPAVSRARAARRRSADGRSQEHEPRASDEPILNDAAATSDAGPSEGTAASRRPSRAGPTADRLVAVRDAQAVLVPDARSGQPKLVQVGERLPSGAVLVSADPVAGRARTDRGVLDLQ